MIKMKNQKNIILNLLFVFLVLSIFTSNIYKNETYCLDSQFKQSTPNLDLVTHSPIIIESDDDFLSLPGTGSEEDPYRIEGYNITTTESFCIRIVYTSKSFTINNCFFSSNWTSIQIGSLSDCHVNISNNVFSNNGFNGIYFQDAANLTLTNNIFTNDGGGMQIRYASNVYASNNTSTVDGGGFYIFRCSNVTFDNNVIYNLSYGITIRDSVDIHILNNKFYNNGLIIRDWDYTKYFGYFVEDNLVNDKILGYFINATSLSLTTPIYGQLYLINCDYANVQNQLISSTYFPVVIMECYLLKLKYNTFTDNKGTVDISNCEDSEIMNNYFTNTDSTALVISESHRSNIGNNQFTNNRFGLHISRSETLKAFDNVFTSDSGVTTIGVYHGSSVQIVNNDLEECYSSSIFCYNSERSVISSNKLNNGSISFIVAGIEDYPHNAPGNYVNGKPIGYFIGEESVTISETNYGQLIFVDCDLVLVKNQIITNTNTAIFTHWCATVELTDNSLTESWRGIQVWTSNCVDIFDNLCSDNRRNGIDVASSDNVTVQNNIVENNQYNGIRLSGVTNGELTNNQCLNNSYHGIELTNCQDCILTYNTLQDNIMYGVFLSDTSMNNVVHHNNFIDNNQEGISQACDNGNGNTWYDSDKLKGNYWNDLGTNETYIIDGYALSTDLYPLKSTVTYKTEIPVYSIITSIIFIAILILRKKKKN